MTFCYQYPRPAVTVDAFVVSLESSEVLLIQRKNAPYQGMWALPGGFLDETETAEQAVQRELREETGLCLEELVQFKTFSAVGRDPRGQTISIVFIGKVKESCVLEAQDDALAVSWFALKELPRLAFDHEEIIEEALNFLKIDFSLF